MKKVVYSPKAQADLDDIWEYTANHWDMDRADGYIRGLVDACDGLASGRRTGRNADVIRAGYRSLNQMSHVVFYRESESLIDIIRILHQRMDLPNHLD